MDEITQRAQELIGHEVRYRGVPCRVIELLDDPPRLILEDGNHATHVQSDQHGEAHRRVPRTYTIPLHHVGPHGETVPHPDLTALLGSQVNG